MKEAQLLKFNPESIDGHQEHFVYYWDRIATRTLENSNIHGFNEEGSNAGEKMMLVVTEIAEAFEAYRMDPSKLSEKIDGYTHVEEELADAVIRIMNYAQARDLRLPEAIIAKHNYNCDRPLKHGKRF